MMAGKSQDHCGAPPRMNADRAAFTQARICRAVAAARACGLNPSGFSIAPDGTITVHGAETASPGPAHALTTGAKPRDARESLGRD
jgi:hypothetical protein